MRTPLLMTTAVVLSLALPGLASAQQGQQGQSTQNQPTPSSQQGGQTASAEIESAKDTIRQAKQTLQQARQDIAKSDDAGQHARTQVRQALQDLKDAAADLKADVQYRQVGTRLETSSQSAMSAVGSQGNVGPDAMRAIDDVEAVIVAVEETGGRQQRSDAEGAQINVDPANPQIAVEAAPPQVQVESRPPQVAVQTEQPQVQVQTRPPEVTVQQPRPEVTVQQPRPEVTVQQARPEVTVQQARPEVTVEQARPEVSVEQSRPQVTVEQARPEVTVERQGEPQVTVEQQGEPQVDVERQQQADVGADARPGAAGAERSDSDLAVTDPNAGNADMAAAGQQDYGIQGWPAGMRVEELLGRDVYSRTGDDIGEVEDVILDRDSGRIQQVVVAVGGFLGIGEHDVALDYDRLSFDAQRDGLSVDTTRDQLQAMESFEYNDTMTSLRERAQ
ncbi:PRC-barrel domain-containing protein [Azospirillum sp. ST 5-10]|uniref:PRC-barrel domain-containing protein n=1 Tax=unclassified Azospirillum TaxID=2630922 RepID=UPI003F4A404F